jgi:anti-sigma regulatory factor (Ser/Thr protein kinase)
VEPPQHSVADPVGVRPVAARNHREVVVELRGVLNGDNEDALRDRLGVLLAEYELVLLDLHRLRILRRRVLDVFPAALDAAGGWPAARLAVFTTDRLTRLALHSSGVARRIWVAHDIDLARMRSAFRPREVRARWSFPPSVSAPAWSRSWFGDRCRQWGLEQSEIYDALVVVNELVSNAVDHAGTEAHLDVALAGSALQLRVRDHCPEAPRLQPHDTHASRGRGLQMVDALATRWGWSQHADGKTGWATLVHTRPST